MQRLRASVCLEQISLLDQSMPSPCHTKMGIFNTLLCLFILILGTITRVGKGWVLLSKLIKKVKWMPDRSAYSFSCSTTCLNQQVLGIDNLTIWKTMPFSSKNGMLHHSYGGKVIFFFGLFYCSLLELNALFVLLSRNYWLLAIPRYKGGNKGSNAFKVLLSHATPIYNRTMFAFHFSLISVHSTITISKLKPTNHLHIKYRRIGVASQVSSSWQIRQCIFEYMAVLRWNNFSHITTTSVQ